MNVKHDRLLSLEILRGVAALAIVFRHLLGAAPVNHLGQVPLAGSDIGLWGVDLFFVLSGFVMVYTQSGPDSGWRTAKAFFRRRLIRIVPLYWVLTAFYLALFLAMSGSLEYKPTVDHVIASFMFVPWPDSRGVTEPVIRVGWSLSYEMLFYALFTLLLLLPRRFRMPLLCGWLLLAAYAGMLFQPENPSLRVLTSSLLLEFLLGALAARSALSGGLSAKAAGWLCAIGAAAMLLADVLEPDLPQWLIFGVPAAWVVLGAVSLEARRAQPLKAPLLIWMGEISYALYLTHLLAIKAIAMTAARLPQNVFSATLLAAAAVIGAVVLAGTVHHFVDLPLRRMLSRVWKDGRRTTAAGIAPAPMPNRAAN